VGLALQDIPKDAGITQYRLSWHCGALLHRGKTSIVFTLCGLLCGAHAPVPVAHKILRLTAALVSAFFRDVAGLRLDSTLCILVFEGLRGLVFTTTAAQTLAYSAFANGVV